MSTPEEQAREKIHQPLGAAAWQLQDRIVLNLGASRGVAVRGFPRQTWFVSHMLFGTRKIMGVIEAKAAGTILSQVADQSALHLTEGSPNMPHVQLPLPSSSKSTGVETHAWDECRPFCTASSPCAVPDDVAGSIDSQVWPSAAEEP